MVYKNKILVLVYLVISVAVCGYSYLNYQSNLDPFDTSGNNKANLLQFQYVLLASVIVGLLLAIYIVFKNRNNKAN